MNDAPGASVPLSKPPWSAVTVWPTESWFDHVTVVPERTVRSLGENAKLAMRTNAVLGAGVAVAVGVGVGLGVGLGLGVGRGVGVGVGLGVGLGVGFGVGRGVGVPVGADVGLEVGAAVGGGVGPTVGATGATVGDGIVPVGPGVAIGDPSVADGVGEADEVGGGINVGTSLVCAQAASAIAEAMSRAAIWANPDCGRIAAIAVLFVDSYVDAALPDLTLSGPRTFGRCPSPVGRAPARSRRSARRARGRGAPTRGGCSRR